MTNYREGVMSPIKMLQTISGICKTNAKVDWNSADKTPKDEFNFIANMIDFFVDDINKEEVK